MAHSEMLLIAGILVLGICCQWFAWRFKIPAILPLLATGFLVGPILGLLHPREFLGELFFPVISLAVAVILFEGALTLKWREVHHLVGVVRNLITVGALVTWIGSALAARLILGMGWELAILFGTLIVVTGPTVIGPLLRNVRPTSRVASILRWESILIDPLGALLAVLVFNFIAAGGPPGDLGIKTLVSFLQIILIGTGSGLAGGYFVAWLLKRYLIPDYLRDITALTVVALVFAVSESLHSESGLLAVTVMGVLLANLGLTQLHHIWHFKEKLTVLLISSLFILLAATFTRADLALLDWRSLVLLAAIIFIVRPLAILISTLNGPLTRGERLFLAWIAPRGIVAASVSSLFAFRLQELGYADARLVAALTFLVIVGTVVLQGGTARLVARWLGVAEAEPQGFLLMGAHPFSRLLGRMLQEEGFLVRLVDTNWDNVQEARIQGLDVYYGNILSELAENDLDLTGLGRLLALTSNDEANALACMHLLDEFGSSEVYQLTPHSLEQTNRKAPSRHRLGRLFPGRVFTCEELVTALQKGGTIKKTRLTPQFTYEDYVRHNGNFIPLITFKGSQVLIATLDTPLNPQPGWTLVSLVL